MRQFWKAFIKRGLVSAWGGPLVLAVIYGILGTRDAELQIYAGKLSVEILSSILLAFLAAGSGAVYTVERLPLLSAALIQGAVLYGDYLLFYLLNGWLKRQWKPVLIFSLCFILGYGLIWLLINGIARRRTKKLNEKLNR